jgi:hypothetical protein
MRKPTTQDMHESVRTTKCIECGALPGAVCTGLTSPKYHAHSTRMHLYLASVAPELPEDKRNALIARIGWYLQKSVVFSQAGATTIPVVVVYIMNGKTRELQPERLHFSMVQAAVDAGWLYLRSHHGRREYLVTDRGVHAQAMYLALGGEVERVSPTNRAVARLSALPHSLPRSADTNYNGIRATMRKPH